MKWFGRKKKEHQQYAENVATNNSVFELNMAISEVFKKPKYSSESRQKTMIIRIF